MRLFTLPPRPPLPLLSVPRLRLRIARSTSLEAEREYLRAMSYLNAALALVNKTNEVGTCSRIAAPPRRQGTTHAARQKNADPEGRRVHYSLFVRVCASGVRIRWCRPCCGAHAGRARRPSTADRNRAQRTAFRWHKA